jgi:hypothetical protein
MGIYSLWAGGMASRSVLVFQLVDDLIRFSVQLNDRFYKKSEARELADYLNSLQEVDSLNWDLIYFLMRKFLQSILTAKIGAII